MEEILFFIFALSGLYIFKNVFDVIIRLFQKEPKKLEPTITDKLLTFGSLAFIITYLIKLI